MPVVSPFHELRSIDSCAMCTGALNSISNSSYRVVAAQIGDAEAYHSALVRTLLYQTLDAVPAYNSTVRQITDAIVAVENKISGAPQLKYGLYNQQGAQISNVDSNGRHPEHLCNSPCPHCLVKPTFYCVTKIAFISIAGLAGLEQLVLSLLLGPAYFDLESNWRSYTHYLLGPD